MSLALDDLCPCGTGKTYEACHKKMMDAPPEDMLNIARKIYAESWSGNSTYYETQGIFKNLAKHLSYHINPLRILDLGCGRGEGVSALKEKFDNPELKIIGIDENPNCLAAAASRLGLDIPRTRLIQNQVDDRIFNLTIDAGSFPSTKNIMLINSDAGRPDNELDNYLHHNGPFDLVTLWFSGTHGAQAFDTINQYHGYTSSDQIRQHMETTAIQFAKKFLRRGGMFHLVNRGRSISEDKYKQLIAHELKQISADHGLSLQSHVLYPYDEPKTGDRITVTRLDDDGFGQKTFISSAIFKI